MLKKYFKNPLLLSITALVLYIAGLIALIIKGRYIDEFFLEYNLPRNLLHISSYVVMLVFCILYKKNNDINPRNAVFAFFVSESITAIICMFLIECNTQIAGAYHIAWLLDLDYDVMDSVILYIQGIIMGLIPFLKGKIVSLYLKITCIMYFACMIASVVLSLVEHSSINAYPFLFLLSAITLNYVVIQDTKKFNGENIGGAWTGILEDECNEYYYEDDDDDYDEEEEYFAYDRYDWDNKESKEEEYITWEAAWERFFGKEDDNDTE